MIEAKQARKSGDVIDLNRQVAALSLEDRFRAARVTGRFDPAQQWLLDNRIRNGKAGYHVYSLLLLKDSRRPLLVNRGWAPVGSNREFLPLLPLPDGLLSLTGRLDTPASVGLVMGDGGVNAMGDRVVLQALRIPQLAAAKEIELLPLALVLDEGQTGVLQYDWAPVKNIGPEKHVGYAVQWFALALALVIIYVGVNTRRSGREEEHASGD